jgi:hypothetical protein
LKPHPLKGRFDTGKRQADPSGEENGKRSEEEVLSVNGEEDETGRRPHFQTARITPFSDRRRQYCAFWSVLGVRCLRL